MIDGNTLDKLEEQLSKKLLREIEYYNWAPVRTKSLNSRSPISQNQFQNVWLVGTNERRGIEGIFILDNEEGQQN